MTKTTTLLTAIFLISTAPVIAASLRGEIQRYTLLHDRALVDRDLRSRPYQQFFQADFIISSGLKDLIGDISDGTDSSDSTVQKQLNMFELLSLYVNTEQFVDLDLSAAVPLPKIKIKKYRFYNSAFYHVNFGVMATVSNQVSVTDPTAQTYVKKETKMGINTSFKRKDDEYWTLAMYQLRRGDLSASINSSTLATDGELFNFDQLNDEAVMFATDLSYRRQYEKYYIIGEIRELKIKSTNSTSTLYGTSPFLHVRTQRKFDTDLYQVRPFLGFHYRRWYNLMRGLYTGVDFRYMKLPVFRGIFKLSNQFFVINPLAEFKYFTFSYAYKSPHRNPQDKVWVPGMHNISLSVPFP